MRRKGDKRVTAMTPGTGWAAFYVETWKKDLLANPTWVRTEHIFSLPVIAWAAVREIEEEDGTEVYSVVPQVLVEAASGWVDAPEHAGGAFLGIGRETEAPGSWLDAAIEALKLKARERARQDQRQP